MVDGKGEFGGSYGIDRDRGKDIAFSTGFSGGPAEDLEGGDEGGVGLVFTGESAEGDGGEVIGAGEEDIERFAEGVGGEEAPGKGEGGK